MLTEKLIRLGFTKAEIASLLGGVYSDTEIFEAVASGHIVIDPLIKENIRGSSVDVTLGEHFYVTDRIHGSPFYNPYDSRDVERYFKHKLAVTHRDWSASNMGAQFNGIPLEAKIIVLDPHERILAHTVEFIGIHAPGTTQMQARSTTGRNGIVVCKDAGWGDPGYIFRWTMEIQNDNDEATPLIVGSRIAQIVFLRTGRVKRPYGDNSKYQTSDSLERLKAIWTPEMMLPKAYADLPELAARLDAKTGEPHA